MYSHICRIVTHQYIGIKYQICMKISLNEVNNTMRSAWTCNKKKNMIWQTGMHILFADMYHGCIHVHRYP